MSVACSSYSWNAIAGHQKRSKEALPVFKGNLLDLHMRIQPYFGENLKMDQVTQEDASWVNAHFATFNKLAADDETFRFALEAAIDWRFAKDPRAAVSRLWGGIEALFDIKTELVFRISLYGAGLLTKRGPERIEKFRELKKLYALRSKAVHGSPISEDELNVALYDSFEFLSALLLNAIARGRVPTDEDLENAVFN